MNKLPFLFILFFTQIQIWAQNDIKNSINKNIYKTVFAEEGDQIYYQGFDELALPAGWIDSTFSGQRTWIFEQLPDFPFSEINSLSQSSAICPWNNDTIGQNEWIISNNINIPSKYNNVSLNFYAGYSKNWLDSANLEIWVGEILSNDTIWKKIWNAKSQTDTLSNSWTWRLSSARMSQYSGKDVTLGFRYIGNNGDLIALDDISIIGLEKSNEAEILTFSLPNQLEEASIDAQNDSIHCTMIYGSDYNHLVPTFNLSAGAYSTPKSGDTISVEIGQPFPIKVVAEDSVSEKIWYLNISEAEVSAEANIDSFAISGETSSAVIDTKNAIIEIELNCSTDLNKIVPGIKISAAATIFPAIGDTISLEDGVPFLYEVNAQDTSVTNVWQIVATVRDYTANILSFTIPGQIGTALIDTVNNTIFIEMPYGSNISNIIPNFTLSDCASSSPSSGDEISFENNIPKSIFVSPKNPDIPATEWKITIKIKENNLFIENFDKKDSIPDTWTVTSNSEKTWIFEKQLDNPFSSIYKLSKFSAICPWSSSENQDEWLISPIISTQSFVDAGISDLKLGFYAGYNYKYCKDNCDIKVLIKTNNSEWKEIWKIPEETEVNENWIWHQVVLSIDSYLGQDIQLAFEYIGTNGDLIALDNIQVFSNPLSSIQSNKINNNWIRFYPNPASSNISINSTEKSDLEIIDLSGRKVLVFKSVFNQQNISLSKLNKGLYILRFISETGKVSIQKLQIN